MKPIITEMKPNKSFRAFVQGNPEVVEEGENETIAIARLLMRLQGKSLRTWNGAFYLALVSWTSVFVEAWLLITGNVSGGAAWGFWFFFFLTALLSSSLAMKK